MPLGPSDTRIAGTLYLGMAVVCHQSAPGVVLDNMILRC